MSKFFASFKGRQVPVRGEMVQVYRNLNKPGIIYSIRDKKTGLVLGHASNLLLSGCKFVVQEKSRQKVVATKRKGIHAWVEGHFGIIHAGDDKIFSEGTEIYYNPYTNTHFEMLECGEPIAGANIVWIDEDRVIASAIIRSWETRSIFMTHIDYSSLLKVSEGMTIKYCRIHEDSEMLVSPCGLSLICYECAEGPQLCHCGVFHSPEDYTPVD